MNTTTAVRPTPALLAELTYHPLHVKPLSQRAKQDTCSAWKQHYRSNQHKRRSLILQIELCWIQRHRELQVQSVGKFVANATILPVPTPRAPLSAPQPMKLAARTALLMRRKARIVRQCIRQGLNVPGGVTA